MRRFIFTALAAILGSAILGIDARAANKCVPPSLTMEHVEDPLHEDVARFRSDFNAGFIKVCNWWGPTFVGPFKVITKLRGPSRALIPAWKGNRGTMDFRKNTLVFRNAAIIHELTHVLAPNGNRFLAEGLAVYAQEHLKGLSAFPNDGEDIHMLAKEFAEQTNFTELDLLSTPSGLGVSDLSIQEAYIVSGSFVRYLIERYGMKKFRELYALSPFQSYRRNAGEPGRWNVIYGKSLKVLGDGWRAKLGKL